MFGRNTIGGAINLTSRRPDFDGVSGKISASVGESDYREFSGYINIPLADNLAGRVAVLRRQHEGYVEALQYDDLFLGDEDVTSLRGRLLWEATDNFELDLNVDYSEDKSHGAPSVPFSYNSDLNSTFFVANANRFSDADCVTSVGQATNANCVGPVQQSGGRLTTNSVWYDDDGNKIDPYSEFENYGISLTAKWAINDSLELKSITAYRELEGAFIRATSAAPLLTFQNTTNDYTSEQFSQEFQLTGTSFDEKLNWVAGLYYFTEDGFERDTVSNTIPAPFISTRPNDDFTVENETVAVFGQGTYDLSDTLHLTLGLRVTDEEKIGSTEAFINFGAPDQDRVVFGIEPLTETNVSPYLSLSHDFSDNSMAYISHSKGFKSGTFSTRTPIPEVFLNADGTPGLLPSAEQETVDAFEVGLKSELMDSRLRANLALFRSDYQDMQVSVNAADGVNLIFVNGGDARLQGLEAELTFLATEFTLLRSSIGLMDAEFTDVNPGSTLTVDTPIYGAPDYKISVGIEHTFRVGQADLRANLDWTFVDDRVLSSTAIVEMADGSVVVKSDDFEPSYNVGSLAISYVPDNANWDFSIFANNLSDSEYRLAADDNSSEPGNSFGVTQAEYARDREVKVKVNYRF